MPQVIVNKRKWREAIEVLELSRELAKQALNQPNHTVGAKIICSVSTNKSFVKRPTVGFRSIQSNDRIVGRMYVTGGSGSLNCGRKDIALPRCVAYVDIATARMNRLRHRDSKHGTAADDQLTRNRQLIEPHLIL
jgi:hypothetical protein